MNLLKEEICNAKIDNGFLKVTLKSGKTLSSSLKLYPTLVAASEEEKHTLEVMPSGWGIHWPLLDYDLGLEGLLENRPELPGVYEYLQRRRGGARPGAGRKPTGRIRKEFWISPKTLSILETKAKTLHVPVGQVIDVLCLPKTKTRHAPAKAKRRHTRRISARHLKKYKRA
jgi:hypothetical protein